MERNISAAEIAAALLDKLVDDRLAVREIRSNVYMDLANQEDCADIEFMYNWYLANAREVQKLIGDNNSINRINRAVVAAYSIATKIEHSKN